MIPLQRPHLYASKLYLLASAVAAVLAAATLFAYLHGIRSRIAQCGRLVTLVVAARDLEAGEVLNPTSLSLVDFPDRYLLPGTFTDPLAASGGVVRHPVKAGEPLLESALLPPGGGGPAQNSLIPGFRAFPLPASSVSFPLAELSQGSRVDVLAVAQERASPLLENVEVLGICGGGTQSPPSGEGFAGGAGTSSACILLQITCEEACRLAAAQGSRVELILRPPADP